ncbi:hypothetical protein FKM82_010722 [Ascaphus truei]
MGDTVIRLHCSLIVEYDNSKTHNNIFFKTLNSFQFNLKVAISLKAAISLVLFSYHQKKKLGGAFPYCETPQQNILLHTLYESFICVDNQTVYLYVYE